jgi:hypothetical protein
LTPKLTKDELLQKIGGRLDLSAEKCCIVGIRGYYLNSLGAEGENDRGIYDDAIFILAIGEFHAFQANTDPAKFRNGIATLIPGVYDCVKWRHHGKYNALQIVVDRITRDGEPGKIFAGRHGINIHKGGVNTTGSEGCQTLPPDEWNLFINPVYALMNEFKKDTIKYLLIDNTNA